MEDWDGKQPAKWEKKIDNNFKIDLSEIACEDTSRLLQNSVKWLLSVLNLRALLLEY
jgi:hypothetical protein